MFDRPMIAYPVETLRKSGASDICIVTGKEYVADFMRFLGSGSEHGVNFTYKIQDNAAGIAHALFLTRDFFGNEKVMVILGDNIFDNINIPKNAMEDDNAYIFLKKVADPQRFGIADVDAGGKVIGIEEKPKNPKSNFAVTGFYIYPADVFNFIRNLKPSSRGEMEITDVNNHYLEQDRLKSVVLKEFWSDSGTFESLYSTTKYMSEKQSISGQPQPQKV